MATARVAFGAKMEMQLSPRVTKVAAKAALKAAKAAAAAVAAAVEPAEAVAAAQGEAAALHTPAAIQTLTRTAYVVFGLDVRQMLAA